MVTNILRGSCAAVVVATLTAFGPLSSPLPAAAPRGEIPEKKAAPRFVGAKLCKTCHYVPSTGRQYKLWKSKDPHSKAFKTLRTDKAKEIAAAKGIENPETALPCLACHESDGGVHPERRGELYTKNEGVGCEGCHGPGEFYALEEVFAQPEEVQVAAGLNLGSLEDCASCHDENSPRALHPRIAEGAFDVEAGWKRIQHPIPKTEDSSQ